MKVSIKFEDIKENGEIPPLIITLDKEKYKLYNRMVNEINPLHFNKKYAQSIGFKTIVVAGVFTYSFLPKMLVDWTGEPASIKKIQVRFEDPAYPGDTLTHEGIVKKKRVVNGEQLLDCEFWVENQHGQKITTGTATMTIK
jgi:acyl dehydratase